MDWVRENYGRALGDVKDLTRDLRDSTNDMDGIHIRDGDKPSNMEEGGIGSYRGAIEAGDQVIGNEEGLVQSGRCGNIPSYLRPRGTPKRA